MKKNTLRRLSTLLAASVMTVVCGTTNAFANEKEATLKLTEASGIAGQAVVVNLEVEAGNTCTGYDIDIEFDDRLELKSVGGYMATETNGNVATIINATPEIFEDNTPVSSLTFVIPNDADENDSYDITISKVSQFSDEEDFIENVTVMGTTINVLETAKKFTNHMVYVTKENGVEISKVALRGDADMDGKVGLGDVIKAANSLIKKGRANFAPDAQFFADVNGDGKVSLQDVIAISRFMLSSDKSNAWGTII